MSMVVDDETSTQVHVYVGVPQGTGRGPLLFLSHHNDLPRSISSQVKLLVET